MSKLQDLYDGKFENLSRESLIIPIPQLHTNRDKVYAKWQSDNTEFLSHNPKYFLFRFKGKGKGTLQPRGKRFTHPTHTAGEVTNSNWWGGNINDASGKLLPLRNSEWEVEPLEGKLKQLDFNVSDYVYSLTPMPSPKIDLRVRSAGGKTRKNAYFYIAIACELPEGAVNGGCPVIFGPPSLIFSARPQQGDSVNFPGLFTDWQFYIG